MQCIMGASQVQTLNGLHPENMPIENYSFHEEIKELTNGDSFK